MAQQALRGHHHQRLTEVALHLAAQEVKELGWCRAVGYLDIVLSAQLQKALQPGARVFGPLALIAVGQEQHQAVHALPLGLGRGEELIDDDLGTVGEVTELRLPDHQGLRVIQAVAELKAHSGKLRQGAVVEAEGCLSFTKMAQRYIVQASVVIDEDGVAVTKGPPL